MLTAKVKIAKWALERLTEIVILTLWVLCFSLSSYDMGSFRGVLGAPLAVLTFEVTSLFALSSLVIWMLFGGTRIIPFAIGALALAHVAVVTSFPSGERLDLLFAVAILLIFLNSLAHHVFRLGVRPAKPREG